MAVLRITVDEIRISTTGSAEAGSLMQALAQLIHGEDLSFEAGASEVVVRRRSSETAVAVLDVVQQRLWADASSEITISLDRRVRHLAGIGEFAELER